MKKILYPIMGIVMLGLIFSLISCRTTVRGTSGSGKYELKRSLTKPNYWEALIKEDVRKVYTAVLSGVKDLGLNVHESKVDNMSGMVSGSFAEKTEFNILISYEAQDVTLMLIRVGLIGDQGRSVQIFQAVEKHL